MNEAGMLSLETRSRLETVSRPDFEILVLVLVLPADVLVLVLVLRVQVLVLVLVLRVQVLILILVLRVQVLVLSRSRPRRRPGIFAPKILCKYHKYSRLEV